MEQSTSNLKRWSFFIDVDKYQFLGFTSKIMLRLGLWPNHEFSMKLFWVVLFCLSLPNFYCIYSTHNNNDLSEFVVALAETFSIFGVNVKLIVVFWKRERLNKLLIAMVVFERETLLKNVPNWSLTLRQKKWVLAHVELLFSLVYCSAGILSYAPFVASLFTKFILRTSDKIENYVKVDYGYGVTTDSFNLGHILFLFTFFLWLMASVVLEVIPPYLTYSSATYFRYIKLRLIEWEEECKGMSREQLKRDKAVHLHRLGEIVQDHCRVIEMADDLNDTMNPIILYYFLTASVLFCVVFFGLIMTSHSFIVVFLLIMYAFTAQINLLWLSSVGSKLIELSQDVAIAASNLEWYNHSPAVQKALVLIMVRAQRNASITAGTFYSISLDSFSSTLSTSISYFTIMKTILADK